MFTVSFIDSAEVKLRVVNRPDLTGGASDFSIGGLAREKELTVRLYYS
jgi:hypothetical protein